MTLTQYGRMAEKHWREYLPKKVQDLESKGLLQEALMQAEEKTKDDLLQAQQDFQNQAYGSSGPELQRSHVGQRTNY